MPRFCEHVPAAQRILFPDSRLFVSTVHEKHALKDDLPGVVVRSDGAFCFDNRVKLNNSIVQYYMLLPATCDIASVGDLNIVDICVRSKSSQGGRSIGLSCICILIGAGLRAACVRINIFFSQQDAVRLGLATVRFRGWLQCSDLDLYRPSTTVIYVQDHVVRDAVLIVWNRAYPDNGSADIHKADGMVQVKKNSLICDIEMFSAILPQDHDADAYAPSKVGSALNACTSAAVSFTHLRNVGDAAKQYAG